MKSIVTALVDPSGAADYGPDAYVEIWSQLPVGAGGTIATDKPLRVSVTETGLSTPPIRAGNYLIRMKLASSRTALGPYPFTMPDGDGTTELWPLIAAGVNIPGDTPIQKIQEALAAYLVANPIDGNGLDQTAVDARVETVGDTRYAPVSLDAEAVRSINGGTPDANGNVTVATGGKQELLDGITEWWCRPVATYQATPYPRTIFGAIAKNGDILACEFNHVTRQTLRYVVARADVDDHNAPALIQIPGCRPLLGWQNHSQQQYFHFHTGARSGDIRSLRGSTDQQITVSGGASYTQLVHIPSLSDATQTTYWMFCRVHGIQENGGIGWNIVRLSVNEATGIITKGVNTRLINAFTNLAYLTISESHTATQIIRCAFGYNPQIASSEIHGVAYFDINVATGAITSPFMPSLAANVSGVGLPLVDTAVTLAIPDVQAGWSRRLFYVRPGPISRAIAYAEGPANDPDNWTYKQLREIAATSSVSGLAVGADGWASGAYSAAMNVAGGFEFRTKIKYAAVPGATMELARRYRAAGGGGDGKRSWYFRITTGRILQVVGTREADGSTTSTYASPSAVPGAFTDDMWYGFRIDFSSGKGVVQFRYSTDGTTWTDLGAPVDVGGVDWTMQVSDCALEVPSPTASSRAAGQLSFSGLYTLAGAPVAVADFAGAWTPGATTYTGPNGVVWTLQGAGAVVTRSTSTWVIDEFGRTGTRIGYNTGANYLGGMAYPQPCPDDVVLIGREAGGVGTIEEWRREGQVTPTWVGEVLVSGTAPRPARPYGVLGGGSRAMLNRIVNYHPTNFYEYEANVEVV